MQGFDEKFTDFPDYILRITREIWEDRGLGARMKEYYHPEVVVRTPAGISFGEPGMTAATMATLVEFPDRELLGEDVIWCGTPEEGMLSSHRLRTHATHTGHGVFGPPTGRRFEIVAIADCYAKDNMISDEWLIRDNGGIVRQLGFDVVEWSREKLATINPQTQPFRPAVDRDGPYLGRGNESDWGAAYADLLGRIMAAEFSVIPAQYDRALHAHYTGHGDVHGVGAADAFWLGLRASFPSARFEIHHVIGREDPLMPPRAALRWSLTGRHDGWGAFGAPTGAEVHVMGLSHAEFGPWGLRREYAIYDETAVWMQILQHTGAHGQEVG